jgi:hypothetical protein
VKLREHAKAIEEDLVATIEQRDELGIGVFNVVCGGNEMDELREAAQQALEELEFLYTHKNITCARPIHDLRAALAQPEQLVVGGDDLPTLTKWTPQPAQSEPMLNGLTEAETNASASVMGLTRPKPEQEPVAWINEHGHIDRGLDAILDPTGWTPLYTHPPQRVPLTEEEIYKLFGYDNQHGVVPGYAMSFVRAIERAHGIGEDK